MPCLIRLFLEALEEVIDIIVTSTLLV